MGPKSRFDCQDRDENRVSTQIFGLLIAELMAHSHFVLLCLAFGIPQQPRHAQSLAPGNDAIALKQIRRVQNRRALTQIVGRRTDHQMLVTEPARH